MILKYDGTAKWLAPVILKSKCPINVKYFPFDEQHCKMKFGSWTYDKNRLDLHPEDTTADTSELSFEDSFFGKLEIMDFSIF